MKSRAGETQNSKGQALLERRADRIDAGRFVLGSIGITFPTFPTDSVASTLIERDRRRGELAREGAGPADFSEVIVRIAGLEERSETRLVAD